MSIYTKLSGLAVAADSGPTPAGKVWLAGAGPGDPDLLTVKALRAIESADLILFDQLVSEAIQHLFPPATPRLYVGKRKDQHSIAQADLNALLVEKARQGLRVLRLKGGDPFVFGRGGEELLALVDAGIDAEVIPGVTAAAGCTAAAGIPLTHRGLAQGCTLVTGHAEKSLDINWQALAALNHTLVFYMGVSKAALIAEQLLAAGLARSTPVALIENGCRANQREIVGEIHQLAALVAREQVQSPALIVVGEVVGLAGKLKVGQSHFTPWAAQLAQQAQQHFAAAQCA